MPGFKTVSVFVRNCIEIAVCILLPKRKFFFEEKRWNFSVYSWVIFEIGFHFDSLSCFLLFCYESLDCNVNLWLSFHWLRVMDRFFCLNGEHWFIFVLIFQLSIVLFSYSFSLDLVLLYFIISVDFRLRAM